MKKAFSRKNLWKATPQPVKKTLGRAMSLFPPSLYMGGKFRKALRFVHEAQWWPRQRSREYQLEQLIKICSLAARTKYYSRVFAEAGFDPAGMKSPEDIQSLPTIDKKIVVENLESMCVVPADSPDVDYVTTGGTSGVPLRFYAPASRSFTEYAYLLAGWERAGYRLGMPLAVLRGEVIHPDRRGFYHEYDPLLRHHSYSNFHTTDNHLREYLEHIATLGPCYLHVYPSSVVRLARMVQRSGLKPPRNIRGVLAGSENVYPDDRAIVEQWLCPTYFSWYGHTEKVVLAAECEHSRDYHVWPTYGHFELLDEQGKAVATPGQRGEIAGTGFINTVMPFIRYRTGDFATYVGDRCDKCGREHLILRDIEGRYRQDDLIAVDGSSITPNMVTTHDDTFDKLLDYQFIQDKIGQAVLCVVPAGPFTSADQEFLLSRVRGLLREQIAVELKICSEVQKTARGKQPRIISKVSRETFPEIERKE
jgi:phenylacetate-CoA ligase